MLKRRCGTGGELQFERGDIRRELFWNLGGNRGGEIFGRGTSGLNSLDTPRSFLFLLLLLLLSLLPEPKSCVLSFRGMCCVTAQKQTKKRSRKLFLCPAVLPRDDALCFEWKITQRAHGLTCRTVRYDWPFQCILELVTVVSELDLIVF